MLPCTPSFSTLRHPWEIIHGFTILVKSSWFWNTSGIVFVFWSIAHSKMQISKVLSLKFHFQKINKHFFISCNLQWIYFLPLVKVNVLVERIWAFLSESQIYKSYLIYFHQLFWKKLITLNFITNWLFMAKKLKKKIEKKLHNLLKRIKIFSYMDNCLF